MFTHKKLLFVGCVALAMLGSTASAQWVARWKPSGSATEAGNAIAVDHSGNVFVAGISTHSGRSDLDFQVIKYDASGNYQWEAHYDGPANGDDIATGIAVDWEGNCYVAGVSDGGDNNNDFTVIKYAPNGDTVWPNGSGTGFVIANGAIRLDDSSDDGINVHDSAKRKCGIALTDEAGSQPNFAITGPTDGGNGDSKWRTVLFQDDGFGAVEIAPGWPVDQFGDIEGEDDQPNAVAIYSDGTVYVTGGVHADSNTEKFATIHYYVAGGIADPFYYWLDLWAPYQGKPGEGQSIALDMDGNAYVTGYLFDSTANNYATRRINKDDVGGQPDVEWSDQYDNFLNDEASSISLTYEVVDDELVPFAFVTGRSHASIISGDLDDVATVRYNGTNGDRDWVARFDGSGKDDAGMQVIAAGNGNVYVIGWTDNGADDDYVLLGYDSAGGALFSPVVYDNGDGDDDGIAIAFGGAARVYVTGASYDTSTHIDFATVMDETNSGSVVSFVTEYLTSTGGTQTQGGTAELETGGAANDYFSIRPYYSGGQYQDVAVTFRTTIATTPSEASVLIESHVDEDDIWQKVEAYDAVNSIWILLSDQQTVNGTDSNTLVTLPGDPARFVDSSNYAKVRVTHYVKPGYSHGSYRIYFDLVRWDTLP